MKSRWTIFLAECVRIYHIIFETRDIEIIRKDFYAHKWISKSELLILKEYEIREFIKEYEQLRNQYKDLLGGFNLNALSNYSLLERREQGKLQK